VTVRGLLADYRAGRLTPSQVAASLGERIAADAARNAWISRVAEADLIDAARALDGADPALPLYGVPFAVKDNIDVAGLETTAACPGFAYVAQHTAPVAQRLLDAGALLIGKTNMDQFATGLVGTRSPYGACASVFDPDHVSGGSSSGSALAVALGHVAFALGTDTAGSGRVPAAFNGIVGIKPTRGLISTRGVVPACASIDCVSIFAGDVHGGAAVLSVAAGFDERDPWSRPAEAVPAPPRGRVGIPLPGQLEPLEPAAARAWAAALELAEQRFTLREVDIAPLLEASPLLYDAWIAERTADLGELVAAAPAGLNATVAEIVLSGQRLSAVDVFNASHRLAELTRAVAPLWEAVDALLLPTTASHPTLDEVAADPIGVNAGLGRFASFVNLMDLASLALPGPQRDDGLPFGVTLHAPAFFDERLLELGAVWSRERGGADAVASAVEAEVPPEVAAAAAADAGTSRTVKLAVAGAHMSGMPLNEQLTRRGARLLAQGSTARCYRLYALGGGNGVMRPGLVRVSAGGASVEIEIWELSTAALGELLCDVPAPLAIGRVELSGGTEIAGFVCEGHVADGARDITEHGGWRAYLQSNT
jgi:allophanate hydrolase